MIQAADLVFRRAERVSDTLPAQNGGRMTAEAIPDAVRNNLFANTYSSERMNGGTRYRKLFAQVASAGNETLVEAKAALSATSGADYCYLLAGADTEADIPPDATRHGVTLLAAPADAGESSLSIIDEAGGDGAWTLTVGRQIRITRASDGATVDAAIDSLSSASGVTHIGLSTPLPVALAAGDRLASVLELGDITATVSNLSATVAGDGALGAITRSNRGAIEQIWTLTFTSATDFRLEGDTLGQNIAIGSTVADFAPMNASLSAPYFTLPVAAWSGAFAAGDTITFTTHPAAVGIWIVRVTPAGSAVTPDNGVSLEVWGET
jgi:hypothetical protein